MIARIRRWLGLIDPHPITPAQAARRLAQAGATKRKAAERAKIMRAAVEMNRHANRPMGPKWEPYL